MKKEIKTSIIIQAKPAQIWEVLTQFEAYPSWNPFIKKVEGKAIVGQKIIARIEASESMKMTFKPTVLEFTPNKCFRWIGHLLLPGIFDGEHRFEMIAIDEHQTQFIHVERFNGILVSFFAKKLDIDTKNAFERMNIALKQRVESLTKTA